MFSTLKNNFISAQFARYVVVGVIGTALDFLILYLLVNFAHIYYLIAATLSVAVVIWVSFTLNKFWTFQNQEKKYLYQFVRYFGSHLIALAVSLAVLAFLVETFDLWYLFAKVFATAAAAITNFLLVKKFIFEKSVKVKSQNS